MLPGNVGPGGIDTIAIGAMTRATRDRFGLAVLRRSVNQGVALCLFGATSLRDLPSYLAVPDTRQTIPYGVSILLGTFIAAGISLQWTTI